MKKFTIVTLLLASLSLWLSLGCGGGGSSQSSVRTSSATRLATTLDPDLDSDLYVEPVMYDDPTPCNTLTADGDLVVCVAPTLIDPDPTPVGPNDHQYIPSPAPTIKPLKPKPGVKPGIYPYGPNDPYADPAYRANERQDFLRDLTLQDPLYTFKPGGPYPIRIGRKDLEHILEEHHPHYWKPQVPTKPNNGFFDPSMTPEDILAYIKEYIRKYSEKKSMNPPYGSYPDLKIGGGFYRLVIGANGEIVTFFPVDKPKS
jgi:hypothetical protein